MIPERKGGCYMPEICNKIGSDILGGTGNIVVEQSSFPLITLF